MGVHAPADKRFRRAHVKPARRRRLRGAILVGVRVMLMAVVTGYASYRAATLMLAAGALRVDRLVVKGNDRLSTGEIRALVSDLHGQNILSADLRAWQKRLTASPWVGRATLRRILPATIEIHVVERKPMGLARLAGRLYLVDHDGVIIDEHGPQHAEFDLPVIDGLAPEPGGDGLVDEARARLAARLLAEVAIRRDLARRISQIDVREADDAVVLLEGDQALIHLGQNRFVERLQSYLELAPALRARVPAIDYVDLRFDERVYVRPAEGSGAQGRARARSEQAPGQR